MALVAYLGFLLAAIYVISRAADFLIQAASGLGRKFHLGDYLTGSLIVGIGTSLPELITSLAAIFQRESVLVAPTIFGTVIANIGAGLGLAAVGLYFFVPHGRRTLPFTWKNPSRGGAIDVVPHSGQNGAILDTPIVFAVFSVIFSFFVCMDGEFSRLDAFWFFLGYLAFFVNELRKRKSGSLAATGAVQDGAESVTAVAQESASLPPGRKNGHVLSAARALALLLIAFAVILGAGLQYGSPFDSPASLPLFLCGLAGIIVVEFVLVRDWISMATRSDRDDHDEKLMQQWPILGLFFCLVLSLVVVFFAGSILVKSVIFLAEETGIGSTVLAASVIAIGTSVPDIVVALKVARQGRHKLLIGHIVQSNVFDVFLIMAICGFLSPLQIDPQTATFTIPFTVALTFCLLPMFRNQRIRLADGLLLFLALLIFLTQLYM